MTKADVDDARQKLQASGWLAATPADFRAAVVERCVWQRVAPRVALTHGGDVEGGLFGVIRDSVDIISAIGPSDSPVAHVAHAPHWFGEMTVVGHRARTVIVMTRTVCDVALLPQSSLEAIMATRPEWWRLLGLLSLDGITLVTQIATDLLIRDTRCRCVAVLLRIAGYRKVGEAECKAGIGQDELAGMANVSRQTSGIILRALEAEGAVRLGYRSITIVDPAGLRAIFDV